MTTIDLRYRPRPWQKACHARTERFQVLALHRRAGKTELALMRLIDAALRFTLEQGLFFYVAPQLKQAKAITWSRLKRRIEPLRVAGLVDVNEGELWVRFKPNGAMIRIYGADNPDAMRGVRLDGVVIDEVAQTKPEVWDEVLQPALSDRLGWALFIGTPNGVNLFSKLFFKRDPDWYSALFTVYDTDALNADEVLRLKRDMPDNAFAREYLCDFAAAGESQLLSLTDIINAGEKVYEPSTYTFAPKVLGVDPARFGDDRSVIFPRQGLLSFEPQVFHGIDNMLLASRVAEQIEQFEPDAVFVDAGNGAGVIDRLRQLGYDVTEVHFGGKPIEPRFVNKRAEMWWLMREWITAGGAIPRLQALRQDLAAPTYSYDAQDRVALEAKDDIKARGLPSPDLGDALALTFAYPVAKRTLASRLGLTPKRTEYDPVNNALAGMQRSTRSEYDPTAIN